MVTIYASWLRGARGEASQLDRAGGAAPCPSRDVREMGSSAAQVLGPGAPRARSRKQDRGPPNTRAAARTPPRSLSVRSPRLEPCGFPQRSVRGETGAGLPGRGPQRQGGSVSRAGGRARWAGRPCSSRRPERPFSVSASQGAFQPHPGSGVCTVGSCL